MKKSSRCRYCGTGSLKNRIRAGRTIRICNNCQAIEVRPMKGGVKARWQPDFA